TRMFLLFSPEVRKELELADEQVAELEKVAAELREKYPMGGGRGGGGGPPGGERGKRGGNNNNEGALRTVPTQWFFVQQNQPQGQQGQGRGGRGGGGGPPTPEQQAEFEKMRLERAKEEKVKLAEILLPHQIKRLNEIFVQQAGTAALYDEDIAGQLAINDAQKAKIAEIRQQNQEVMGPIMREMFQGDRDAARAKLDEIRKATDAKLVAVLSADQQKKFEEMKGKPFAMPEGAGRGGPGGGRGG